MKCRHWNFMSVHHQISYLLGVCWLQTSVTTTKNQIFSKLSWKIKQLGGKTVIRFLSEPSLFFLDKTQSAFGKYCWIIPYLLNSSVTCSSKVEKETERDFQNIVSESVVIHNTSLQTRVGGLYVCLMWGCFKKKMSHGNSSNAYLRQSTNVYWEVCVTK